jgi:hypothetical protein
MVDGSNLVVVKLFAALASQKGRSEVPGTL